MANYLNEKYRPRKEGMTSVGVLLENMALIYARFEENPVKPRAVTSMRAIWIWIQHFPSTSYKGQNLSDTGVGALSLTKTNRSLFGV